MNAMKRALGRLAFGFVIAACVGENPDPLGPDDCAPSEKTCNRACVAIDDPRFGCSPEGCAPCVGSNDTNTTPGCLGLVCASTCLPGFADCDNDRQNGCEVRIETDVANCGACGNVCGGSNTRPNGARCERSKCAFDCADGFGHCSTSDATGCETSLTTSTSCGACTHDCRGGACGSGGRCGAVKLSAGDFAYGAAIDGTYVYYAVGAEVRRLRKDNTCAGGPPCSATWIDADEVQGVPRAVTTDGVNVFWAHFTDAGPAPVRSHRDGVDASSTSGLSYGTPSGGMTAAAGRIWWTNAFSPSERVVRMNANGEDAGTFASGAGETLGIASDGNNMYWVDRAKKRIYKMPVNAASCDMEILLPDEGGCPFLTSTTAAPSGVAVDTQNVYFTAASTSGAATTYEIHRMGKTSVGGFAAPMATLQAGAENVATDGAHVYWTNPFDGTVRRVAVDKTCTATGCESVIDLPKPSSVVVDDVAVYATSNDLATAGGGLYLWVK